MSADQPKISAELSLEEKIGQLFFIGLPGLTLDLDSSSLLNQIKPGGVCLFARNIKFPEQTRELLDGIRESGHTLPFLSVDQEGGLVDRLRRLLTPSPAAAKFKNANDVLEFAEITAFALRILGFNMDFAPVVDVITEEREIAGNGMFSRAFGRSGAEAAEFAGLFLDALQQNGIIGCLKHFPGLGAARADSHEELPIIDTTAEELSEIDLRPYRRLLDRNVEMVMVAHAAYPASNLQERDQNGRLLPSSLSSNFVSKLLRYDMGFDGIAITDDLEMGAIVKNYGIGEACKMAVNAGDDMLAICAKPDAIKEGFEAVVKAVESGEVSKERIDSSLARINRLKAKIDPPPDFDEVRLHTLTKQLEKLNSRLD